MRASVSEERRRREGKSQVEQLCASKQVSTLSLFKAFFLPSILGFSRPNMNRSASPKANTMEVWCLAASSFDFSLYKTRDFVARSNQTTARPRMFRGNTATYCELDSKFETLLMKWVTKHDVKLANTFQQRMGAHKSKDKQAGAAAEVEALLFPSSGRREVQWQEAVAVKT